MAYTCSKDPSHQSEDSDYCSICGAKIAGAVGLAMPASSPAPAVSATNTSTNADECPDCHAKRTSNARFCEVCRYDFERQAPSPTAPPLTTQPAAMPLESAAGTAWPAPLDVAAQTQATTDIPIAAAAPTPVTPAASAPDAAAIAPGVTRWEVIVVVDPTLYTEPDPGIALPTNEPERVFPLDFAENLLGRRSDRKDIHPEIPVGDPGVSHRHAKLLRQPDGSFILLDVGSTNGTRLNDVDVLPGVRTPLHDGDQITVGCWTRITIRCT